MRGDLDLGQRHPHSRRPRRRGSAIGLPGARSPLDLAPLISYANDLAFVDGTEQIRLLAERADHLLRALDGFRTSQIPLRLHAKALRPGVLPAAGAPLFVDILDL